MKPQKTVDVGYSEYLCGHCGQTIVVADHHLGQNVQCPHCQQFVQAPNAAAPPREPAPRRVNSPVVETPSGDDAPGAPVHNGFSPVAAPPSSPPVEAPTPKADVPRAPFPGDTPKVPSSAPLLPTGPYRPPQRQRNRATILLLVFLIPYALAATAAVGWLLHKQSRTGAHPLEWLLDQQPADGGPKQIKHDLPLNERQKTSLAQPFQLGDAVELTALDVAMNPAGDQLLMTLKIRNTSKDQRFNPVPQSFLVRQQGYTFLQFGKDRIYGGKWSYRRDVGFWARWKERRAGREFDGVLGPGEEMTATLATPARDEAVLRKLADTRGPIVWRLEVRRGLVAVGDKTVSATAVVGVEFDAGVALRDQRELVRRGEMPNPLAFFVDIFYPL